jgi:hypothetical protein
MYVWRWILAPFERMATRSGAPLVDCATQEPQNSPVAVSPRPPSPLGSTSVSFHCSSRCPSYRRAMHSVHPVARTRYDPPDGSIGWVNLVVRHALLQLPSLPLGGALTRTGWCEPLRSSEPPTSVGLACRPVGAWRRHLVKQNQSTRGGPGTDTLSSAVDSRPVGRAARCTPSITDYRTHLVRSASAEFESRARWTRWRSLRVSQG